MPRSALEYVQVDHIAPASEIGPLLSRLVREDAPASIPPPTLQMLAESDMTTLEPDTMGRDDRYLTEPSAFTCPECSGTLWELVDGDLVRYRCRVGHSFSPDSMQVEQAQATERALWMALRSLEERAALSRKLADNARRRSHAAMVERFERRAADAERDAAAIRRVLLGDREGAIAVGEKAERE
jgi:two-component system chemotaxis response regulator CheB